MARWFDCPYCAGEVELTDEREAHIEERHPELLPSRLDRVIETLFNPDMVQRGRSSDLLVFSRWYDSEQGEYLLVFVVEEPERERNWILTSRYSFVPEIGELLWRRS